LSFGRLLECGIIVSQASGEGKDRSSIQAADLYKVVKPLYWPYMRICLFTRILSRSAKPLLCDLFWGLHSAAAGPWLSVVVHHIVVVHARFPEEGKGKLNSNALEKP
jgi:hypothetical protein